MLSTNFNSNGIAMEARTPLKILSNSQAHRQLNWIGGGGVAEVEVNLRPGGTFLCYTSASVSKKAFAKIFLSGRHGVKKWESGGLPPEEFFEKTPSRMSDNSLFAK